MIVLISACTSGNRVSVLKGENIEQMCVKLLHLKGQVLSFLVHLGGFATQHYCFQRNLLIAIFQAIFYIKFCNCYI